MGTHMPDGAADKADGRTGKADGPVPEPAEALAALVAKLRTELAGVRTAMRNRAVIEQAKGVLVERLGISPDEGFDHLVRLSQRANVKLIEVAAAIVGTTAPDPSGATVGWPSPASVVVTLLEPDGAHLFVGAYGIRAEVRSQWRRLPPHVDMPVAVAVRDRATLLLPDEAAVYRHFPELRATPFAPGAVFAAPLLSGDRVLGSLGVSWSEPVDLGDEAGRYLSALTGPGTGEPTLLSLYPELGSRLLLPELARVLRDGLAARFGPVRVSDRHNTVVTGRAARLWDRVLLVWRELGEAELIYPQLLDA